MANRTLEPELYEVIREESITRFVEYVESRKQAEVGINITNGIPTESTSASCLSGVTYGGDTALHIAARFGKLEIAEMICQEMSISLLTKGNTKLETPLHYAAQTGKIEVVSLFIQLAGEEENNINLKELLRKRNREGETALYQAVNHEHKEVAEELLRAGVDLASIPDNQNTSPLYLAMILSSLPILTCLVELLPQNASRGAYAGPHGRTVLHAAALRNKGNN